MAAIVAATPEAGFEPSWVRFCLSVAGFQFRNAVQILQGLPSGPRTMPGGSGLLMLVFAFGSGIFLVGMVVEYCPTVRTRFKEIGGDE